REPEVQTVNKETILEKIRQLEIKIQEERQNDLIVALQLQSELHNTSRRIVRQRQNRIMAWLPFIPSLAALLRQWGLSLLHIAAQPFRHIRHLHLLTPVFAPAGKAPQKQSVSDKPHQAPQIN
ncbi:relaxase, partial [Enterobacter soli]